MTGTGREGPHELGTGRVLVTGASGFIGRHAVGALADAGATVVATNRGGAPVARASTTVAADLADDADRRRLVEEAGCSHLLHAAWYAGRGADRWHGVENLRWVERSLLLADTFLAAGGRRVVGVGTCAEYDWATGWLDESTPLRPATRYGAAKAAVGVALPGLARSVDATAAWARVYFVYGPGEGGERLVPSVAGALLAGCRVPTSAGHQRRDFLEVGDVARALAVLVGADVSGPVDVAGGDPVPVRHVVESVAGLVGRPELVGWGERPADPDDAPVIASEARRLRALGWGPEVPLDEGVARYVGHLRTEHEARR